MLKKGKYDYKNIRLGRNEKDSDGMEEKLLWVDLEMTGLVPGEDRILEVAALVTDWDFKVIDKYEGVVKVEEEVMKRRMVGEFWEKNKKVKKKLVCQNKDGKEVHVVEQELLWLVERNFRGHEKVLLAGNSIHQDRKFIDLEWPKLAERLNYRMLDVSALKVMMMGRYGFFYRKGEKHRAMEDILGSIEEMQSYVKLMEGGRLKEVGENAELSDGKDVAVNKISKREKNGI